MQMKQHADAEDNDMEHPSHCWCRKIEIADKYGAYRTQSIYKLLEFQHMWNGRLRRIITAKQ